MDVSFNTSTKDYKAILEAIEKLGTLKERLQYYNDNYKILIITNGAFSHLKVNILQYYKLKIFCTCNDCKDLYSTDDFEVYRNFVNNQTDAIVKYFDDTTDYKAKIEYYYNLNDGYPQKTSLTLKYVPNTIDEVKDYYNLKETSIDVTPQTETEFNILLEFVKKSIINSTSRFLNYNYLIFENRVNEISNYLEFITDENDRKDLIKKYLNEINLDKIDVVELKKQRLTNKYYIPEILKITDKIIQKNTFEKIIDKTNFRDIQNYLLALETIKFKKFLNSLNVPISEQNKIIFDNLPIEQKIEIRTTENKVRNHKVLNQYYNSIKNIRHFESAVLNRENELYYIDRINEFTEYRNSQLDANDLLNGKLGILKPFNFQIKLVLQSVVSCYKSVIEWKKTNNELHENNLEIRFSSKLQYIKNEIIPSILYNYDQNPELAFRLNEYCLNGFDLMITFIENQLMIDIKKSPLFPQIQELIKKYKDAIDVEKIKVLANTTSSFLTNKEPQQTEVTRKVEVKKNEYIEIFANDLGQTLFFELHNIYKGKKNKLANYSFLFYALEKNYLVCTGTKFKEFLSDFDINIDKIDTRQSGTNNKTLLFNSILTRYSDNTIKAQ